jgi:hypothetical protein
MTTNKSFFQQISFVHIDIDGEKHPLQLDSILFQLSSVDELRTILSERYQISNRDHHRPLFFSVLPRCFTLPCSALRAKPNRAGRLEKLID